MDLPLTISVFISKLLVWPLGAFNEIINLSINAGRTGFNIFALSSLLSMCSLTARNNDLKMVTAQLRILTA